jgi:hypothetical protein
MALHVRAVEAQDLAEGPTQVDPALADAGERRRLSGPAMRAFLAIADRWRLSEEQRLRDHGGRPACVTLGRAQAYAERLRAGGEDGIVYDSLRHAGGVNVVPYDPRQVLDVTVGPSFDLTVPVEGRIIARRLA